MWLRLRNLSPNLELRTQVACDNFAKAAMSLPQHFLIMIKSRNRSQTMHTVACKKWMNSSITIAASSVCKHEIFTDRLNKIQLRTVWCSINFYFCSKQTMNVFFHCTFAWICADFSYNTAFISYHVMIAKTRVLKCCCLLFDWTDTQLSFETWLAYDDFREKTWLDHGTKTTFFT